MARSLAVSCRGGLRWEDSEWAEVGRRIQSIFPPQEAKESLGCYVGKLARGLGSEVGLEGQAQHQPPFQVPESQAIMTSVPPIFCSWVMFLE